MLRATILRQMNRSNSLEIIGELLDAHGAHDEVRLDASRHRALKMLRRGQIWLQTHAHKSNESGFERANLMGASVCSWFSLDEGLESYGRRSRSSIGYCGGRRPRVSASHAARPLLRPLIWV